MPTPIKRRRKARSYEQALPSIAAADSAGLEIRPFYLSSKSGGCQEITKSAENLNNTPA
jgi:hypothetical protein